MQLILSIIDLNIDSDEIHTILQSHTEGSSLRGISRITQRAYGTVVSVVRADERQKAQIVHNARVQKIETDEVSADVPAGLPWAVVVIC